MNSGIPVPESIKNSKVRQEAFAWDKPLTFRRKVDLVCMSKLSNCCNMSGLKLIQMAALAC